LQFSKLFSRDAWLKNPGQVRIASPITQINMMGSNRTAKKILKSLLVGMLGPRMFELLVPRTQSFLKKRIRHLCMMLGIPTPVHTTNRRFLEQKIFPLISGNGRYRKILFAGTEIYTWHYHKFFPRSEFCTIDYDKSKSRYGHKNHHTIGSVCSLSKYYNRSDFDVIIYNGLIGFGLNSKHDVDQALCEAFQALSDDGILIVGWNNTPEYLDFCLETLPGYQLFTKYIPVELGVISSRIEANPSINYMFDFLIKRVKL
jgi:hypothetical protein